MALNGDFCIKSFNFGQSLLFYLVGHELLRGKIQTRPAQPVCMSRPKKKKNRCVGGRAVEQQHGPALKHSFSWIY